jgi:hypothetical protein
MTMGIDLPARSDGMAAISSEGASVAPDRPHWGTPWPPPGPGAARRALSPRCRPGAPSGASGGS